MPPAIAISGLGAVSALGSSVGAVRDALATGRDGLRRIARFDVTPFEPVVLGGCVAEDGTCEDWAVRAALEAWADADAGALGLAPERVAVVVGTEAGSIVTVARAVAEALGARGFQGSISTACTSSANAIGIARDLIQRGDADLVLAGGAERLSLELFAGFYILGVLSAEKCSPFGETRGTTLGEGAGFVVLERAGLRERAPYAYLNGYGLSSDAWHETTPEPRGEGIARAMRGSLEDACISSDSIGYVNAHGTGTAANDDAEWRGILKALGRPVPVSGSKCFLGHAQGAAAVLELITTLVCFREGTLPPTLRVGAGRPNGPPDPVAGDRPRPEAIEHALANSAAFGGANAVLCVGRRATERALRSRVVRVRGVGLAHTPAGEARDEAALAASAEGIDLRSSDASARSMIAACARGLRDAGLRVRGPLRERAGLFAGSRRISPGSSAEYRQSADRDGVTRVSAAAFARIVVHAPAGAASRAFALRGPTTTLADGELAGLLAFAYAADWLATRDDADVLLACGLEESEPGEREEEGAACLVLGAGAQEGAGPRVLGVAMAGPRRLDEVIAVALVRAGVRTDAVDAWHVHDGAWSAPSFRSARLVVEAVRGLRQGVKLAVVAAAGASASCAVVVASDATT
jgi:3-oxoacyl-[acyl-carrier-protein] synthase II